MHIFIDARRAAHIKLPQESTLYALYLNWALQHPEVHFTWLLQADDNIPEIDNINTLQAPILPVTFSALDRWYKKDLPKLWKSAEPDVLIPVPGYCCTALSIDQYMWLLRVPGKGFLEKAFVSRLQYRWKMPSMLQKAKAVWFTEAGKWWQSSLKKSGDTSGWKFIQPAAINDNAWYRNESVRYDIEYHTGGRPFFASIISGNYPEDTMQLMRSFSLYKKRQKTDWKLVLIGEKGGNYAELTRAISAYKYKDDVVVLPATRIEKQMAFDMCYALIQGKGQQLTSQDILSALEKNCAMLITDKSAGTAWIEDTAYFPSSDEVNSIAEGIMKIYKDEDMIRQLRENANRKYKSLTVENQAAVTWLETWK